MKKIIIATVTAAKQPLAELIQFMLTKNPATKNPEMAQIFQSEKASADRYLMGIAKKRFIRSPYGIDPSEEVSIVLDEMMQHVLTPENIQKFQGQRTLPYLGTILDRSLLNYLARNKDQKNKVRDNISPDEDMDSQIDHSRNPNRNPEDIAHADQLYAGITKFLLKQNRGKEFVLMFNFMIEGYSSQEIADRLKISKGAVSQWTGKLKAYLLDYAHQTKNSHLEALLGDLGGRRNSATDEMQGLRNVFIQYKKKKGQDQSTPAGKVSLIDILGFEDLDAEEYQIKAVQNPGLAPSSEAERLNAMNRILTSSGDVTQEDGKVFAIRS